MRKVNPYDLELFTINTGAFYELHKMYARNGTHIRAWIAHVRNRALPRYCREIEPVSADTDTVKAVAQGLQAYYAEHIRELTGDG
jgi:hypothetical protein